jgi:hypothetical protein
MHSGCLNNLANHVTACVFHIQPQEFGDRRRYVDIGNLCEPGSFFCRGSGCDENRLHRRIFRKIAAGTAVFDYSKNANAGFHPSRISFFAIFADVFQNQAVILLARAFLRAPDGFFKS